MAGRRHGHVIGGSAKALEKDPQRYTKKKVRYVLLASDVPPDLFRSFSVEAPCIRSFLWSSLIHTRTPLADSNHFARFHTGPNSFLIGEDQHGDVLRGRWGRGVPVAHRLASGWHQPRLHARGLDLAPQEVRFPQGQGEHFGMVCVENMTCTIACRFCCCQ